MKNQVFNPYLPCYEYIADGEPRVFDGRLYIFGSHDKFDGRDYCENDYVTWSAPVDDLSDWRYEGVIYRKDQDLWPGNLYAPDVVQGMDGRYYLYYSKADTSVISVAVCDTPAGQYEYLGDVSYPDGRILGVGPGEYHQFDPSVLVDEGRVWLYSGSGQYSRNQKNHQNRVGCMVIELEPDMVTVKQAPKILFPGSARFLTKTFFEGASARKINGIYYLVFPINDLTGLNCATSKYPDRDFTLHGSVHSMSDIGLGGSSVRNPAYPLGNNHGGLVCIRGHLMRGSLLSGCPYLTQDKPDGDTSARQYVAGVRKGSPAGYKYFDFPPEPLSLTVQYRCSGTGSWRSCNPPMAPRWAALPFSKRSNGRRKPVPCRAHPGKTHSFSGIPAREVLI